MSDPTAIVAGLQTVSCSLHVSRAGVGWIDAVMADDSPVTGTVTCDILGQSIKATVSPFAGEFGLQRRLRLLLGAGQWSKILPRRPYHNDAGVQAQLVASDAAREAGETLGAFAPLQDRMGPDFTRFAGLPASATLELAAGGRRWWVNYDGTTQVGERATAPAAAGSYEILSFDPRTAVAEIALDELAAVGVGSILTERLVAPITVAAFDLEIKDGGARMWAWCPPDGKARSNDFADQLEAAVTAIMSRSRFGRYRCTVVGMTGKRANLKAARVSDGLPDMPLVQLAPGVAGTEAQLKPGSTCWVEFEAGDIRRPLVTGFEQSAVKTLTLGDGSGSGSEMACKGDTVSVLIGPTPFSGTILSPLTGPTPAPITGVLMPATPELLGSITTGRASVRGRDA